MFFGNSEAAAELAGSGTTEGAMEDNDETGNDDDVATVRDDDIGSRRRGQPSVGVAGDRHEEGRQNRKS